MKHRKIRSELAAALEIALRQSASPIVLRDYQRETIESTIQWLRDPNGSRAAYVSHATGLGKTLLFALLVSAASTLKCLVVVPKKLLVTQTVRQIVKFTNHAVGHVSTLGKIHDESGELVAMKGCGGHRIVVTTDQSFKRRAAQLAEDFAPDVVIRDECHWSYTEKSVDAADLFRNAVVIGYSATPDFLTNTAKADSIPVTLDNGQTLYASPDRVARAHYPTMLDRRTVRWGIENGFLAPLAWGLLEFECSLDDVPVVETPAGMDYDAEKLREALSKHWPLMEEAIRRLYEDNVYDIRHRQVCAICPGVAEAESLAKKVSAFVPAACITGGTNADERDRVLTSFDTDAPTADTVRFISSVFVLREGWDSRNAEIALMLRPTKSRVLYEQFLGRILRLRLDGREKVALALDAHFLRTRLAPLSAPVLYGVPGQSVYEGEILIGPKRDRSGRRIVSPYHLPKDLRPKLRIIEAVQIEFWANEEGLFQADGEWWGTTHALAKEWGLHDNTVALKLTSCRSREGKSGTGRLCTFYARKDAEVACADLLKELPTAGADGMFEADGEKWGTIYALTRKLGLSSPIISHLPSCRSREGKTSINQRCTFYALKDMEAACAALLKELPTAGADGMFEADGEWWGTVHCFARRSGLSKQAIFSRIASCRSREGKASMGKLCTFYARKDAEAACADLLKELPTAGDDGLFEADGEWWGTIERLARKKFRLSPRTIKERIEGCRTREGKDSIGNLRSYYALKDIEVACADLLKELPTAGDDGLFEADGEWWGTVEALARKLRSSVRTFKKMGVGGYRSRKGRDAHRHIHPFYALKDVESALIATRRS